MSGESSRGEPRPPRLGLCGCGRWGKSILRDLVALGCDVAVADPSPQARAAAIALGASGTAASAAELPALDAAIVATPTLTHEAAIAALLPRGIPVACEKPLTADPAAAARLAATAPDRLFVMDKWRYHPGVEMLGAIARSGELGAVVGVRTMRRGAIAAYDVDPIWVVAPQDLCIGLEVLGSVPQPRRAESRLVGGSLHRFEALLGREPWLEFHLSIADEPASRNVELHCRQGVARLADTYDEWIEVSRGESAGLAGGERRPISTEPPLQRELRALLDHVRGGPPPRSSAAEGSRIVSAIAELCALAGHPAAR